MASTEDGKERDFDVENRSLLTESRRAGGCSPLVREILHWTTHFLLLAVLAIVLMQQDSSSSTAAPTTQAGVQSEVQSEGLAEGIPAASPIETLGFAVKKGANVCSGHGTQHSAGSRSWCVCFDCWQGSDCQQPSSPCMAVAMPGDPIVFEDYWVRHDVDVRVGSGFKLGYLLEAGSMLDPFAELTEVLKALHGMVHNIDTTDTYFVFGGGGTHLLAASLYAHSKQLSGGKPPATPVKVWEKRPYFNGHSQAGTGFETAYFEWQNEKPSEAEAANVVEFVCGPNNPDGELREPEFTGSRVVWDMAYRWPFYTPIGKTHELGAHDIALFTMSKVTGHAGTRLGWAMTKDKELASFMRRWVSQTTLSVPRDTAYRATALFNHLVETKGAMFGEIGAMMARKWEVLTEIFSGSDRFDLQPSMEPPEHCLFEDKVKPPSPAYAWVRCVDVDASSCDEAPFDYFGNWVTFCGCAKVFKDAGVMSVTGESYGGTGAWTRIQLLQRQEDFDLLASKLRALVKP
mmetsp:Transcript_28815/g.68944  ORF Transcript_28815/g.68944 Transcript_28815/m.68944 type:complete len:516 (-) Transcript_28815:173-1720(-)|eukprot:CAMPEP_0177726030 /NCGR_PEP_ID=MMETSP0484_2-20121128/19562_1 /TAXON_ID=354590 /ORGANISM="Rhodomonas lens, Strain RHODO" /LENGTH=515 /DNA_ID=CAMNT_0019238573 /DNA_START=180 /DNA_END=1727 /DNA_ORIENTATION=-